MRKNFFFLLFATTFISAVFLTGCKKDESTPTATATSTVPKDLTKAEAVAEMQNGSPTDPRGTYYVNSPFMVFITNDQNIDLQYKSEIKNGGSGTLKFEGSSATQGTWTTTNISVNVDLILTVTQNSTPTDYPIKPTADDLKGFNGSLSGTWATVGDKLIMMTNGSTEPADTSDYGITSKGLFIATEAVTSVLAVKVLKK